jgi:hypothetical protein
MEDERATHTYELLTPVYTEPGARMRNGIPCTTPLAIAIGSATPISSAPDAHPAAVAVLLENMLTSIVMPDFADTPDGAKYNGSAYASLGDVPARKLTACASTGWKAASVNGAAAASPNARRREQ